MTRRRTRTPSAIPETFPITTTEPGTVRKSSASTVNSAQTRSTSSKYCRSPAWPRYGPSRPAARAVPSRWISQSGETKSSAPSVSRAAKAA